MNDSHLSNRISKRTKKGNAGKDNDPQQRERKRALDRKAQRASREKTRSHIAHLERMVRVLSERNGSTATNELLEEISTLHAEIDRLKKVIDGIKCLLGVDIPEVGLVRRRLSHSSDREGTSPEKTGHCMNDSVLCEVRSPSADAPDVQNADTKNFGTWAARRMNGVGNEVANELGDVVEEDIHSSIVPVQPRLMSSTPNLDRMGFNEGGSNDLTGLLEEALAPTSHLLARRDSAPSILRALTPTVPDYEPCEVWRKANTIYARIFEFDRQRIAETNQVDSGSLVRVVKCGWESLSLLERSNPIFEILREVDQYLFWDLDPITKIANLYKSMRILKYYFNAGTHNLEKMPEWQRPVPSQKSRRHPLPIDFFPWPALRDRLVRHHNYYFGTADFSVNYRHHFKFSWPFGFDDIYGYDHDSKSYQLSPLFERYHRDVRCWSMEKVFFEKFPEFVGEISIYEDEIPDIPAISSVPAHRLFPSLYPQTGKSHNTASTGEKHHRFADDIMELFDECPPT